MKRLPVIAWLIAVATLLFSPHAEAQSSATYEKMVAVHAKANQVPEALVHRVIVRESKYRPDLIGRGGTIGLMQIKLATARGLGYQGDAEGLHDPETNLTYGVKYLAGAYRAAEGNHDRAVHFYASGYYEVAKRQRLERLRHPETVLASAPPKEPEQPKDTAIEPKQAVSEPKEAETEAAVPVETEKPEQAEEPREKSREAAKPKQVAARPKATPASKPKPLPGPLVLTPILAKLKSTLTPSPNAAHNKAGNHKAGDNKAAQKKLAEAKERVPRPPTAAASGANATKPR